MTPCKNYGSLSAVVQRAYEKPDSLSSHERQQLESVIGTRATGEIMSGKRKEWVPEFEGIFAQFETSSSSVDVAVQANKTNSNIDLMGDLPKVNLDLNPKGSSGFLPAPIINHFTNAGYPEVVSTEVYVDDVATKSVPAQAYTMGKKIVVRSAEANNPEILGHEATHRYHQEYFNVEPNIADTSINNDPKMEQHGDANDKRIARNKPVSLHLSGYSSFSQSTLSSTSVIQRVRMDDYNLAFAIDAASYKNQEGGKLSWEYNKNEKRFEFKKTIDIKGLEGFPPIQLKWYCEIAQPTEKDENDSLEPEKILGLLEKERMWYEVTNKEEIQNKYEHIYQKDAESRSFQEQHMLGMYLIFLRRESYNNKASLAQWLSIFEPLRGFTEDEIIPNLPEAISKISFLSGVNHDLDTEGLKEASEMTDEVHYSFLDGAQGVTRTVRTIEETKPYVMPTEGFLDFLITARRLNQYAQTNNKTAFDYTQNIAGLITNAAGDTIGNLFLLHASLNEVEEQKNDAGEVIVEAFVPQSQITGSYILESCRSNCRNIEGIHGCS